MYSMKTAHLLLGSDDLLLWRERKCSLPTRMDKLFINVQNTSLWREQQNLCEWKVLKAICLHLWCGMVSQADDNMEKISLVTYNCRLIYITQPIRYFILFCTGPGSFVRNVFVCQDAFMELAQKLLNAAVMMDLREWFVINVWNFFFDIQNHFNE